ncbi:hypothetical protein GTN30_12645 (plasmid) [Macrococcoides canis]|uniref:Uncharacterized protein n=1 Tax=Macrococcoides canis TaxID=1855823 RepID=A0AAE7C142_9STAP|nr:hypothetical protein [Macrococcus canis]QIH79468.1 hypothetical protein GTN30_12645 [Macrococcus canis]
MRFDNIYNHNYADVIALYPALADSLSEAEFNERKAEFIAVNKVRYFIYTKYDAATKQYKTGVSRFDDKRQERDFIDLIYFNSLQEVVKYIDECVKEDRAQDELQRIEVTCNRNLFDPNYKTQKKKYSVAHDYYTLYVHRDARLFSNYECFYYYFD